jgi:TolB protein
LAPVFLLGVIASTPIPAEASFPGTDGKIVFSTDRVVNGVFVNGIATMDSSGSKVKVLTNGVGRSPTWSPDGTRIAFDTANGCCPSEIYTMHGDGTHLQQITQEPLGAQDPTWAPDGRRIAFTSPRDGNYEIYRIDLDGSHLRRLTKDLALDSRPEWSPLGNRIAFLSDREGNGTYQVFTVRPDGQGLTQLTYTHGDVQAISWSPDGKRIAFDAFFENQSRDDVFTMKADGTGVRNLTNDTTGFAAEPAWSPDGASIAYANYCTDDSNPNCFAWDVFVMNTDGSSKTNLTPDNARDDDHPDWQPVGT